MEKISTSGKAIKKLKYTSFLKSPVKDKWKLIGVNRRSGFAVPLFSIYSNSSIGIGEFTDLKLLIDWCRQCGFSILQLLPLFDTGSDFAPYSSTSSFALDLMYLNINELREVDLSSFKDEIKELKISFQSSNKYVDYRIKKAKEQLLFKIFKTNNVINNTRFQQFVNDNEYWLPDYAFFKVLSEKNNTSAWECWNEKEKKYDYKFLITIKSDYKELFDFHLWVQWQIHEQLKKIKEYAQKNKIHLIGDIPFLASRNSADVWAHQNYFNLDKSAGAPPDMFFASGQKWGMPPYDWDNVAKDKYIYLKEKLKSAENYFDMYRIDHFVGLFRIWTVENNIPPVQGAINGKFEPEDEHKWEKHGKKIIEEMLKSSIMLPCAEDLGTVPPCSFSTLEEYSIPGIDFQRFKKKNNGFIKPEKYRKNSISMISTHDLSFFINWWDFEAGGIDEKVFNLICEKFSIKSKKINIIKEKLFDKNKSKFGRLYWKEKLTRKDIHKLFSTKPDSKKGVTKLFLDSFNEKEKFLNFLGLNNKKIIKKEKLVYKCLEKINHSSSIFSIQFLQDYLCLDSKLIKKINKRDNRINIPGTCDNRNWSVRLPLPIEKLKKLKISKTIYKLNSDSDRIV